MGHTCQDNHHNRWYASGGLQVRAPQVNGVVELAAFRKGAGRKADDGHYPDEHADGDACIN